MINYSSLIGQSIYFSNGKYEVSKFKLQSADIIAALCWTKQ